MAAKWGHCRIVGILVSQMRAARKQNPQFLGADKDKEKTATCKKIL
jgi:hypothetical protein